MADHPSDKDGAGEANPSRRRVIRGVAGIAGAAAFSSSVPRSFADEDDD